MSSYLIPPEQRIPFSILKPIPKIQELSNTVLTNVLKIWNRILPCQGLSHKEETHDNNLVKEKSDD
jgi:hypothetical protein